MSQSPPGSATAAPARNLVWDAFGQPGDALTRIRCHQEGAYRSWTWDQWRASTERCAAGLRELGVRPGTRVACVLTNSLEVSSTIFGIWLAGGVVVSLPTMQRGMRPPEYVDQLRRLCTDVGTPFLLLEQRFIELLEYDDLGLPVHGYESLPRDAHVEVEPPADDELAFVQFSSGSTSDPKGVMLTMGAISEQERLLWDRLEVDADSRGVMWLPLSHDMGLFGCLMLSWVSGMRLTMSSGDRFLRRPQTWFDDCAEAQATITVAPNFGLALATRRARSAAPQGSCPLRTVVLGGERVEWDTLVEADEVLGPAGATLRTLTPAYGLAEATLAVTLKELDELPHAVAIDTERAYAGELSLSRPGAPGARSFVACGPPAADVSLRIEGPGDVGRICVRSPALAEGYLGHPDATERRFADGELITEDLGFLHEGELYVLGRTDDVIPLGGRNLHARDVELAVEACDVVRRGCSALLEVAPEGDEPRLVLVAEIVSGDVDLDALAGELARIAHRAGGIRVRECVFLKPGELPKTPSGKVQRYRCRAIAAQPDAPAIRQRVPL